MKATAVIGMNFGDEGKGHITNYLSDTDTLNIRFNGGSQASHSVFLSDGRSHVFHHFGSGSLRGARTLLASHFIVNPLIFTKELWDLSKKTPMREVFIDPRCRITTPYDMLINEFISIRKNKHDTCGIGINETVERSSYRQLKINARDFAEKTDSELKAILELIDKEYLPYRIKELNLPLDDFLKFYKKVLNKDKVISSFLTLRSLMLDRLIVVWPDDNLIDKFLAKDKNRKLVFEAGQGMLLDQNRVEYMPYLTRSSTGVKNVLEVLKTVRTPLDLEVFLVTRSYLTRHGDGPLWNHIPNTFPFANIEEPTNETNRFQGEMRYGYLNQTWYEKAILETKESLAKAGVVSIKSSEVNVAMTCCDHIGKSPFMYCLDGNNSNVIKGEVLDLPNIALLSKGRTEKDVYVPSTFGKKVK